MIVQIVITKFDGDKFKITYMAQEKVTTIWATSKDETVAIIKMTIGNLKCANQ